MPLIDPIFQSQNVSFDDSNTVSVTSDANAVEVNCGSTSSCTGCVYWWIFDCSRTDFYSGSEHGTGQAFLPREVKVRQSKTHRSPDLPLKEACSLGIKALVVYWCLSEYWNNGNPYAHLFCNVFKTIRSASFLRTWRHPCQPVTMHALVFLESERMTWQALPSKHQIFSLELEFKSPRSRVTSYDGWSILQSATVVVQ